MPEYHQLQVDEQEAVLIKLAEKALLNWRIEGDLRLIKYRENAVYEISTPTGEKYAMRLHRPGYHSDRSLYSEFLWLDALKDYGIGVPTVILDKNGNFFTRCSLPDFSLECQVDVLAWIDGEQIGSCQDGLEGNPKIVSDTYKTIGRVASQMHNQACQWEIPKKFERHAWDMEGLVGDNPFWGHFWELSALKDEERDLVLKTRDLVRFRLLDLGQSDDSYSLIHADFVPENILASGSRIQVIDFDDAGFGWHLFDLATALYFIQNEPTYDVTYSALIEGYREFRSLPDEMLDQLPLFLAARSFTYLGWAHTRPGSETANSLTPMLIDLCCQTCRNLIKSQSG